MKINIRIIIMRRGNVIHLRVVTAESRKELLSAAKSIRKQKKSQNNWRFLLFSKLNSFSFLRKFFKVILSCSIKTKINLLSLRNKSILQSNFFAQKAIFISGYSGSYFWKDRWTLKRKKVLREFVCWKRTFLKAKVLKMCFWSFRSMWALQLPWLRWSIS